MKYYLSLTCIIKNERNLEEFILYYYLLGVEHFYIYDNDSTIPIQQRLNNYFFKKMCTIINYSGKYRQQDAYNHSIKELKNETEWLIIVDGDEYIVPVVDTNLRTFLNKYDDIHAIGINWIIFGTSNHKTKQNGLLIDSYRYCNPKQNPHIKTICKPKHTICSHNPHTVIVTNKNKYVDPHRNILNGPFNENKTIDLIRINHYFSKSEEEVYEKHERGNADSNLKIEINDRLSNEYNLQICNLISDKYSKLLEKMIRMVACNYKIYKALNPDIPYESEIEIYEHSIKNGINENRYFHTIEKYPDFDKNKYLNLHPELANLNDIELEIYFIKEKNDYL